MIYQVIITDKNIPPIDFGGAERICFFLSEIIRAEIGENIIISAKNLDELREKITKYKINESDTLICHSDWITKELLNFTNCHIYHYSHYPYAEFASILLNTRRLNLRNFGGVVNTARTYRYVFRYIQQVKSLRNHPRVTICGLSRRIIDNLKKYSVKNLQYWPNPILLPVRSKHDEKKREIILVLGKVEKRKRQTFLQRKCKNENLRFIGPKHDVEFDYQDRRYLGILNQLDLEEVFKKAKCLVLASDGEAQAQVIFEALGRGVPIACTKEACWDLRSNEVINIFDTLEDLVEFIDADPDYNYDHAEKCLEAVCNFSSANAYAETYLKHLR